MRFADQVVVVTGSTRGIGYEAARQFGREGATVGINGSAAGAVHSAVDRLHAQGIRAFAVAGDVSDSATVHACVGRVLDEFGRIDVLVNNAGIVQLGSARETAPEDWRRILQVNLDGVFFWSQAVAVDCMIPRRQGSIVNVASIAGLAAVPNMAAYVASKHGVVGLTKALAVEWGQFGIRVNAVCPGLTWTDMPRRLREQNPAFYEERERRIPLGRGATPEDQARAILFLASHEAANVHGTAMHVDGGTLAMSSGYALQRDPQADH